MANSPLSREEVIPQLAEVFREFGFEGTTLTLITRKTHLGKGSLYHFFPGGKEEMAAAVLGHINGWFENQICRPLNSSDSPIEGFRQMLKNVEEYFASGQRVCLVGMFALGESRDRFREPIQQFFAFWRKSMSKALLRAGLSHSKAGHLADEVLIAIQGALVLSRASDDRRLFGGQISRLNLSIQKEIGAEQEA